MMEDVTAACTRLCLDYARLIDRRDFEAFAALFKEDGVLDLPGRLMEGRAQIFDTVRKRPSSVVLLHVCTNILIEARCATEAIGSTYLVNFRYDRADGHVAGAGVALAGIYDDQFLLTACGWKFSRRTLHPLFVQ